MHYNNTIPGKGLLFWNKDWYIDMAKSHGPKLYAVYPFQGWILQRDLVKSSQKDWEFQRKSPCHFGLAALMKKAKEIIKKEATLLRIQDDEYFIVGNVKSLHSRNPCPNLLLYNFQSQKALFVKYISIQSKS